MAGLPYRVGTGLKDGLPAARGALLEENRQLRNELLLANARLTRLRNAAIDNAQLRGLLGVAERGGLDVQLAPILDIDLEPSRQRLMLAAGSRQACARAKAVIDAGGLLGQVVEVTPTQSTVLLLTDPDHAVPVMIARNGVRLIAYGGGDRLELRDVPLNRDVQVGDVLVTSGLGGRFPPGFPVAKITALRPDESRAFPGRRTGPGCATGPRARCAAVAGRPGATVPARGAARSGRADHVAVRGRTGEGRGGRTRGGQRRRRTGQHRAGHHGPGGVAAGHARRRSSRRRARIGAAGHAAGYATGHAAGHPTGHPAGGGTAMSRLRDGGWILPTSLFLPLLLGLLPLSETLQPLRPYWLALILAYWVIEAPSRAG